MLLSFGCCLNRVILWQGIFIATGSPGDQSLSLGSNGKAQLHGYSWHVGKL